MTEFTMDRLWENLEALKMKNTLKILDYYLERAVAENLNIVDVLDHLFAEKAKSKRKRAYEKRIQMSGFPIKKTLDDFDFSFQPSIDKCQIDELATMRFLKNAERGECGIPWLTGCGQNPPGFRFGPCGCSASVLHLLRELPPTH